MSQSSLWRTPLFLALVATGLAATPPASRPSPERLQAIQSREAHRVGLAERHLAATRDRLGLDARHAFRGQGHLTDDLGQTHARFRQQFRGVPVWGGDVITHVDPEETLLEATDALARGLELNVTPTLRAPEVLALVHRRLAPKGGFSVPPTAELVVYPHGDERATGFTLAYHVHTELDNPLDGLRSTDFLVDAHSGEFLRSWNALETESVQGTGRSQYNGTVKITTNRTGSNYEMRDLSRPTGTSGNVIRNLDHSDGWIGSVYTDADNTWGDGQNYIPGGSTTGDNGQTVAVDAAYGLQSAWDYFQQVHGRNGIDNTGKPTFIGVHRGTLYDNAAWSSTYFGMILGDGSGTANGGMNTVASLDVVAHEFSHGVCANSAKLVYAGESGGLNEANSDINGTMVEFHARRGGGTTIGDQLASGLTSIDGGNWTIGEQLEADPSKPMRYMYKPNLDGMSPDFWYPDIQSMDVHYSGGPMNRAFYFLSAGADTSGPASTASNTPAYGLSSVNFLPGGMTGIGNDKAARIWYRALTSYLTTTSGYFEARKACQRAATDLYGAMSSELAAVNNAFAAINVGNPAGLPDDTTAPVAQAPIVEGGTSGPLTFRVAASDDVRVDRVLFYVDANLVGKGTQAGGTWELSFDSTGLANGTHSLMAKVYDGYNNLTSTERAYFTTTNTTYRPLINASFENGLTSWNQVNSTLASKAGNIHTGVKAAWFGGYGSAGTGSIYQSVDLPATAANVTAGFWVKIITKDKTSANNDTLKVTVKDEAGTKVLGYIGRANGTFTNLDAQDPAGYVYYSSDITSLKGQKVRFSFEWSEDAANATAWYVDDVHLQISTTATPTVGVSVSPATATLSTGATQLFTAAVTGASNTAVTWKASGGLVTNGGLYTAPATAGVYTVTATSVADPARSATATVTVTEPSTSTEQILNGGFENGANSWTGTTGAIGTWAAQPAFQGTKNAWLCGDGKAATETLAQTVTIPGTANAATLSFQLHIDSAETTSSTAYDKLAVSLLNASGTPLKTLATYSNLNKAAGYQVRTFDVSEYRGQTVQVHFKATEDSVYQTSFALDNISLNAGGVVTPTVGISLTPATVSLKTGATQTFTAAVTGTSNTGVTWKASGGTITSGGLYTAPATAGTYTVTATSVADTSKSATATVTVTEPVTVTEKILNGGFENGSASWTGTTAAIGTWPAQPAFQGTKNAWLAGNGKTTTETLAQTVTIPSAATSANLTFQLHIDSAETTATTAYDKLAVSVLSATGTTLKTLATYSNVNKAAGYQLRTFDLSAYKGQTVQIHFKATEDSVYQTSFVLDNLSLAVK